MRKLRNRLDHFIARHMSRRLAYWVGITIGAYATTGEYGNTIVPDLRMTDALKRWHDDHELGG